MATMTSAALSLRALEYLGIKSPDQAASAEDTVLAQERFDAAFSEYRFRGMCPFEASAIPEWAQDALIQIVAARCSPYFGKGTAEQLELTGSRKLAIQLSHDRQGFPIVATYY